MAGLQDFRKQHPEYDDIPDRDLADKLYQKYYTDIPRQEFEAKMFGAPQKAPRAAPSPAYAAAKERYNFSAERPKRGGWVAPVETFNENVGGFSNQMLRNLGIRDEVAGGLSYGMQGIENLVRRGRGQPIEVPASVAYQAAADNEKEAQAAYGARHPRRNIGASIMGALMAGKPAAAAPKMGMFEAGAKTAAVNLPFAVARQEGSLAERAPGAAKEEALAFGLGAGGQGLINMLGRTAAGSKAARVASDFERAGVRPTMAATQGGVPAGVTKMISENFVAGGPARAGLHASLDDTAAAAEDLARRAGGATAPELAGEGARAGVKTWTAGFKAKADAQFSQAIGPLAARPAAATETERVIGDIVSRVSPGTSSAEVIIPNQMRKIEAALQSDRGALTFKDLRAWRTWVREAQDEPALAQTIDNASLQRLEAALTDDIYRAAWREGGPRALRDLKRADDLYRAGQQRIARALSQFARADGTGQSAYNRIVNMAGEGGSQNTRALASLKRSLAPEDWNTIKATVLSRLGALKAGAAGVTEDGAFSVSNFVTNYAKLSEQGRRVLFGSVGGGGAKASQLLDDLDNLARVADAQKGVEAMVNASRSGVNVQNFGSLAGLASPQTMVPTAGLLGTMYVTGAALTNPAFVRWLASAPRAGATGGMAAHLQQLARLASRDPALVPVYERLSAQLAPPAGFQSPAPENSTQRQGALP